MRSRAKEREPHTETEALVAYTALLIYKDE